ncbi:MAG: response regulator [Rhodospirillales bacterium]|nr:response regulator [Rhodospirillales bacterium]
MDNFDKEARQAEILIVDDNPANVMLLEKILEKEGFAHVYSTTDPRVVLGMYEEHRFDLILLDIRMPHLDGFQVMEQLSKIIEGDYLPVLILTAQTDKETRLRALELGAKDFITKPFDQTEVLQRIRNMLEVRILYNFQRDMNEILEEKVRERTQELTDTRLEIIRRLGRAGEYRDNETGMHVIRMSKSCQALALGAGLSEETAEMILNASPMHDVGKIGIPDGILLKPGKLTAEEWETMKTHSEIGADILDEHSSEMIQMAQRIALTHHEKWDGSGYPKGLKGEEIPIEGRIAAVCDVFDALTSDRPYKKAWPIQDAINHINENSGSHFDPRLVEIFNKVLPEILRIREQHMDEESSENTKPEVA